MLLARRMIEGVHLDADQLEDGIGEVQTGFFVGEIWTTLMVVMVAMVGFAEENDISLEKVTGPGFSAAVPVPVDQEALDGALNGGDGGQ